MKIQSLGQSSIKISRLAYGNMRTAGTNKPAEVTPERIDAGIKSHIAAYEAGYTHFDTADIYCGGQCEQILGKTLKQVKGMREAITIASKCAVRHPGDPTPEAPRRPDVSAKHILWSCDNTLKNLGIETLDLYYLHRTDQLMEPAEVAEAIGQLKKAGKIREFAVSNFRPSTLTMLQTHLPFPIVANQVRIHPGQLDPFINGTLDQCMEKNITPMGYSPVAGGWLAAGRELDPQHADYEKRKALVTVMDAVAGELGVSRTVATIAWILKHPAKIVPIVGSTKPDHIKEMATADDVEMSRIQWYRIITAANGGALP